jgi:hypothetical protein
MMGVLLFGNYDVVSIVHVVEAVHVLDPSLSHDAWLVLHQ